MEKKERKRNKKKDEYDDNIKEKNKMTKKAIGKRRNRKNI